jgi:hypothetical protein
MVCQPIPGHLTMNGGHSRSVMTDNSLGLQRDAAAASLATEVLPPTFRCPPRSSPLTRRGRTHRAAAPQCPQHRPSKLPTAFNPHRPTRGSGLVQPVFRSPARLPALEATTDFVRPRRQAGRINRAEAARVTRSTRTDRRRTPRGRWDAGNSLEKITNARASRSSSQVHPGMPVETRSWVDLRLATQAGILPCVPELSLLYWLPKAGCSGRTSQKGNSVLEEVFLGLAQRLDSFLADPVLSYSTMRPLDLRWAICVQDFLALKSMGNPTLLDLRNECNHIQENAD